MNYFELTNDCDIAFLFLVLCLFYLIGEDERCILQPVWWSHSLDASTWEADAGGSLSSRTTWSTQKACLETNKHKIYHFLELGSVL